MTGERYELTFRRRIDQQAINEEYLISGFRYFRVECAEDELIGEKERIKDKLEDDGAAWDCTCVRCLQY